MAFHYVRSTVKIISSLFFKERSFHQEAGSSYAATDHSQKTGFCTLSVWASNN